MDSGDPCWNTRNYSTISTMIWCIKKPDPRHFSLGCRYSSSSYSSSTPFSCSSHLCSSPLAHAPPLSSHWLCILPYSGLCRGPLERLRRSGGDRQCSRHHTQPGRTTLCMCNSDIPSSCSVTSSPPLIVLSSLSNFCVFVLLFLVVFLFFCLIHYWSGFLLISTCMWTMFESKRRRLMFQNDERLLNC